MTNSTTENLTSRSGVARAIVGGLVVTAALFGGVAPLAGAQDTGSDPTATSEAGSPSANAVLTGSAEIASAIVEPSVAYLTIHNEAYVMTPVGTYTYDADYSCTGFVVDGAGYIATAGHCVDVGPGSEFDVAARYAVVEAMLEEGYSCGDRACTEDDLVEASYDFEVEGTAAGTEPDQTIITYIGEAVAGAETRVVDYVPFAEGDAALVKIEADGLPALELADSTDVTVGTEIVSVGYPGVTAEVTTAPTMEFTDGKISSVATKSEGAVPILGVSSAVDSGMSGGPTVDLQGRVLGINSFGITGHNDHAFVVPSSLLAELLSRAGVDTELSDGDLAYRAAFAAWEAGDYIAAEAGFAEVTSSWPGHEQAMVWQQRAHDLVAEMPKDPESNVTSIRPGQAVDEEGLPSWLLAAGVVLVLVLVAAGSTALTLKRQADDRARVAVPWTPMWAAGAQSAAPQYTTAHYAASPFAPEYSAHRHHPTPASGPWH